jgi:hypothetical protein
MATLPAPAHSPAWWLPAIVAVLGPADKDPVLDRWTWQEGDVGVFVDKLTHAWQTVAWTPRRSVTLRGQDKPGDADLSAAVALAGLRDTRGSRGEW